MNLLFFTDIHILEKELDECKLILDEIIGLANEHKVEKVFDLGDTFDSLSPTSAEFDLFANFVIELNRPISIIAADSHESSSSEDSIVNHFGVLNKMVTVQKQYIDSEHLFAGHFIVNQSKKNKGGNVPGENLKKYKYVILGHGHSHELIVPNLCQLGSCRWINFNEAADENKVVLLITNYKEENEKCHFIALSSPIPMKDVYYGGEAKIVPKTALYASNLGQIRAICDSLAPRTKVRIIFNDFNCYKDFLPYYSDYEKKFTLFKDKKEFLSISADNQLGVLTETISLKGKLIHYMETNKVNEEVKNILLEEIK